ncbi:hypothetical protein GCM10012275_30760 [Longimycelium tulufanense]|uniref:Methyltransferase type 11 domain-containing protein n=1 Tax=Longimycelium tulufanense TaxID=907463 RepID=A0A8J3CDB5_9PSEU|nr:methyltransferase domain-containing protein [Longimycelium tulufanense]GGM57492.1 hypothetical protein GCM10012275_30760 [Longimycelium tulufanense]
MPTYEGPLGWVAAKVMVRMNAAAETEAVLELAPDPAADVLVIGFGPGLGVALLAERLPRGHVSGVDPSTVMLREATRRNRPAIRHGRVELRSGSTAALPYPDQAFDAALTVNTIQLWQPFDRSVAEVARVLRPGARLVSVTHDWAIRRRTGMDVEKWAAHTTETFARHGFVDVRHWRARAERGRSVALVARRNQD